MCGILAYYQSNQLTKETVDDTYGALQKINHRGPDGEGMVLINTNTGQYVTYTPESTVEIGNYNFILAHKRLAIFDLSAAGHQPMLDTQNDCIIIFNGEIYNFIELKKELQALGHQFTTNTDTEVILKAYKVWGTECVKKFNGMWSFVLFDLQTKQLFISRDRFGIKPMIYHTFSDKSWAIVSEEKQLFAFQKFSRSINYQSIELLLKHRLIGVGNTTFFENVLRFNPGHYAFQSITTYNFEQQVKYYEVNASRNFKYKAKDKDKAIQHLNKEFYKAMDFTLRADVPVGLGFSGGVDSSRIVYECYEKFQKPETFSAVFPNTKEDESYYINLVKDDLQLKSNFCYPEKEFTTNDFEKLTYHMDTPVPSASYYAEWCVSRLVKEKNIKVLLVGQGGDEVFAGYHHHFYRYLRILLFNFKFATFRKELAAYGELKGISKKHLNKVVFSEVKLIIRLKLSGKKDWSSRWYLSSTLSDFLKDEIMEYQIPYFLKANDRIGMAFNFESRYPFLDHELVDFGFQCADDLKIKDGWQKWMLRASNVNAPEQISWRKDKIGYVMPANLLPDFDQATIDLVKEKTGMLSDNNFINYSVGVWLKQFI